MIGTICHINFARLLIHCVGVTVLLSYFVAFHLVRNKKKLSEDPAEKANLDMQFKSVQTEWSKCSKRLAEIEDEIEKATKAAVPQVGYHSNIVLPW